MSVQQEPPASSPSPPPPPYDTAPLPPLTDLLIDSMASATLDPRFQLVYRFPSPSELGLFTLASPTGNPILRVGVSDSANVPPKIEGDNGVSGIEGVEGAQWTRVSDNISQHESLPVYLWIAQYPHPIDELYASKPYLASVSVVDRDTQPSATNIEIFPINDTHAVLAHYQNIDNRDSADDSPGGSVSDSGGLSVGGYHIGDNVDCLDTVNTWLEARIIDLSVKNEAVLVHYEGWAPKWDEWIPLRSKRLARYRTHTAARPSERPFTLKNEAKHLLRVNQRLDSIVAQLKQQAAATTPPTVSDDSAQSHSLPSTHPFYPLSAPLSSLLSSADYQFLLCGDNFKYMGHVVNGNVEDTELYRVAINLLSLNAVVLSYALHFESVMTNLYWPESFMKYFGGNPCYLYHHFGSQSQEKEDESIPVFASREAASKRLSGSQPIGPSPVVGLASDQDKNVSSPSVILINNINLFGRYGGFAALQRQLAASMNPAPAPATIPAPTAASGVVPAADAQTITDTSNCDASSQSTIQHVVHILRALSAIRLVLDQSFAHTFVSALSLPNLVRHHLHAITDDELKSLDKSAFREVIQWVQSILLAANITDTKGCTEFHDSMTLHISLRMINAQVLATRLEGIAMLETAIKASERTSVIQQRSVSDCLQPASIASFIEDRRIIESLLGRDSHEQIVKRSPLILKFLAQQQKLAARHLDLLYQACVGKHEGVTRIVYDLLADLAQVLTEELLDSVYARISEKPLHEYRDFDILLMRNFTYNAVRNRLEATNNSPQSATTTLYGTIGGKSLVGGKDSKPMKWYGLNTLWELSGDSSVLSAIQQQAAIALAMLLSLPEFKPQLMVYLDKCLSTLSLSTSSPSPSSLGTVVPALTLAQSIIEKQPEVASKVAISRSDLIAQLEQQNKLLTALVENIIAYEKLAATVIANAQTQTSIIVTSTAPTPLSMTTTNTSSGDASEVMIGNHTHGLQLNTRFAFLSFLLASSRLSLSQHHIDSLWLTFVPSPSASSTALSSMAAITVDSDLFFRWLASMVEGKDPKDAKDPNAVGRKLARVLFLELLCNSSKLDHSTMTQAAYECFETFFIFVNRDNEALLSHTKANLTVIAYKKLDGLDALWSVVTHARSPLVTQLASMLLTSLHLRLDFLASSRDKREIMKKLTDRCVASIQSLVNSDAGAAVAVIGGKAGGRPSSKSDKRSSGTKPIIVTNDILLLSDIVSDRLSSLLSLLDLYLYRLQRGDLMDKPKFAVSQQVKATWKSQKTVYDARVRAINRDGTYHVEYADNDVDERTPERNLHSLDRGQHEAMMTARETQARHAVSLDGDESNDAAFPRSSLANDQKCFELLFRLLGQPNSQLSQQASDLLNKLPVNADLATAIKNLGQQGEVNEGSKKSSSSTSSAPPDWPALLPSSSIPKLLYTLRVLSQYALPPPVTEPQTQAQAASAINNGEGSPPASSTESLRAAIVRWDEIFVMKGGFKHMYSLLMSIDDWTSEPINQKCLSCLLQLIQTFLSLPSIKAPVHDAIDHQRLSVKLFGIVQQSVTMANKIGEPIVSQNPSLTNTNFVSSYTPVVRSQATEAKLAGQELETHGSIILTALDSLHAVLTPKPEFIPQSVLSLTVWDSLLNDGILSIHSQVRLSLSHGLLRLAASFPTLQSFLLPRLLSCLPQLDTKLRLHTCQEYFELVRKLIERHRSEQEARRQRQEREAEAARVAAEAQQQQSNGESPPAQLTPIPTSSPPQPQSAGPTLPLYDARELLGIIAAKISSHPTLESNASILDPMLCGLLSLAHQLLTGESSAVKLSATHFVADLLQCLFETPTSASRASDLVQPPKCKSSRSRELAFACLSELASDCPVNGTLLATHLSDHHRQTMGIGTRPHDWLFEPRHEEKSVTNYLGLANLGCICYMNAPLQQLFMIPTFRQSLLRIDEYKDAINNDLNESLLYQLQLLFAQLQESEQQACSPAGFCHAFKDLDGRPTDVRIQDDSGGFVQKLLDRLCMATKSTAHEKLIPAVLGGELCHELIGRGHCPHYRDRSEEFYGLSVEVQNKQTLESSLQSFIEGELLDGGNQYKCDQCAKKVDTLKRTCIRKLPPSLFFILKRFQLDYNTMETIKLNDRLEFPHYLDMRPYCKESLPLPEGTQVAKNENASSANNGSDDGGSGSDGTAGREDSYYQYVLRGVVVHTGSANGGHYYSFVQERGSDTSTNNDDNDASSGRWMKMNDSVVTFFDPKDIADECFGGVEEANTANAASRGIAPKEGQQQVYEKYRNAYLVFYDRVAKPIEDIVAANEKVAEKLAAAPAVPPAPAPSMTNSVLQRARGLNAPNVITRSASSSLLSSLSRAARFRATVPQAMFDAIWKQNMEYWRDKAVFDKQYGDFMLRLAMPVGVRALRRFQSQQQAKTAIATPASSPEPAAAAAPAPSTASTSVDPLSQELASLSFTSTAPTSESLECLIAQLSVRYLLTTLARSRVKESLPNWLKVLKWLFQRDAVVGAWLLHGFTVKNGSWIREFLMECPDPNVVSALADLLSLACKNVVPLSLRSFSEDAPRPMLLSTDVTEASSASEASMYGSGVAVEFGHALVSYLHLIPVFWRTMDNYFRILNTFAAVDRQAARWLAKQYQLSARLLDLFLNDASLHPELNAIPTNNATGKRVRMNDEYVSADMSHLILLLGMLFPVMKQPAVLPVSRGTNDARLPQPSLQADCVEWSEEGLALLLYPDLNNGFLVHVLQLASTKRQSGAVGAMLVSLVQENWVMSSVIIACIKKGLEWFDWNNAHSYFRCIGHVLAIQDSLTERRADTLAQTLLDIILAQLKYWKMTEVCVEHTLRLAKRFPLFLDSLHQRSAQLETVIAWQAQHQEPPLTRSYHPHAAHHSGGVQMTRSMDAFSLKVSGLYDNFGLSMHDKIITLESIARVGSMGEAVIDGEESEWIDNRTLKVGDLIDCLDTAEKWLVAEVKAVDGSKAFVQYAGWSSKWNEWIDFNDPRIARYGTQTKKQTNLQQPQHGSSGNRRQPRER